uniref:Uncharacterized protein n=1 Tax=Romanomermis culicivorax TaxID=13658 RepID=A0A915L4S7_ROMCU
MPFVLETIIGRHRCRHCFRYNEKSPYKTGRRSSISSLENRRSLIYVENYTTPAVFTDFGGELLTLTGCKREKRKKSPTSESRSVSVQKKPRRFAPPSPSSSSATLTLVCWNFLSVLLFLLALGVSNANGNNNNNLGNVNNKQYNFRNKQYNSDRFPNHHRYSTTSNSLKHSKGPYHNSLYKIAGSYSYNVEPMSEKQSMLRRHNFGQRDYDSRGRNGYTGRQGTMANEAATNKGNGRSSLATTGSTPLATSALQHSSQSSRELFTGPSRSNCIEQCHLFSGRTSSELCRAPPSLKSSHKTKVNHVLFKWRLLSDTYLFSFESGQLNLVKFFNVSLHRRKDLSEIKHYGLKDEYRVCVDPWKKKTDCERCFDSLRPTIAEVTEDYYQFDKRVLSKFECTTTKIEKVYSSTANCSLCRLISRHYWGEKPANKADEKRVFYVRWLLVTRTSVMVKRPCIEWCELVELACPHVTPSKKHHGIKKDLEHAGLPSFRCRALAESFWSRKFILKPFTVPGV